MRVSSTARLCQTWFCLFERWATATHPLGLASSIRGKWIGPDENGRYKGGVTVFERTRLKGAFVRVDVASDVLVLEWASCRMGCVYRRTTNDRLSFSLYPV
jgi:hypothetical protein